MTSKKLKKTFTAAFLSGSILLQNFPALAAASDTTDWLKESPFRQDITTEKVLRQNPFRPKPKRYPLKH